MAKTKEHLDGPSAEQARRRLRLSSAIVLCFFIAALAATHFGSNYLIGNIATSVRDIGYSHLMNSTKIIVQSTDDHLSSDLNELVTMADESASRSSDEMRTLLPLFAATHNFPNVVYLDATGHGFDSSGNTVTPASLPAEETALKGVSGVSGSYNDDAGYARFMLQAPIKSGDSILGGLYAEVIPQRYYSDNTFAFWEGNGRASIFSATDGTWIIKSPLTNMLPGGFDTVYEAITASDGGMSLAEEVKNSAEAHETSIFSVTYNGNSSYLCLTPSTMNPDWYLMSLLPVELLDQDSDFIVTMLRITQIVVVIGLIVAFFALMFYLRELQRRRITHLNAIHERTIRAQEKRLSEIAMREYDFQVITDLTTMECRVELYSTTAKRVFSFLNDDTSYRNRYQETLSRVHPDDVTQFEEYLDPDRLVARFTTSKDAVPQFHFRYRANDETIWLECSTFFSETNGNPNVYIMNKDVTEEMLNQQKVKQATEERERQLVELQKLRDTLQEALRNAEQANSAKSRFLSNMSHDIRTPMNAIIGMTNLATQEADDPQKVKECLSIVAYSSYHLLDLINDILDISKIESGKFALVSDDFDFNEVVEQTTAIIGSLCAPRKQTLTTTLNITHNLLIGDPTRLSQVLINLLNNSCKYTPVGGAINLTIDEVDTQSTQNVSIASFRIAVSDNGIGIAEENLDAIFEAFEREIDSTVNAIEGTGLGLAITKSIVQAMGGTISVESVRGEGATFTVILSLKKQPECFAPCANSASSDVAVIGSDSTSNAERKLVLDCTGKHFLLAEDHRINQMIATKLFNGAGAAIDVVPDGKQALEAFERSEPGTYDAIFLDIQMPVMNGYDAARAIRASTHPDAHVIRIIAMTANVFAEDKQASYDAGMDAHIDKPIEAHSIAEALRRPTGRHR